MSRGHSCTVKSNSATQMYTEASLQISLYEAILKLTKTHFFFETESYVVQDDSELVILLPLPPECWDKRRVSKF